MTDTSSPEFVAALESTNKLTEELIELWEGHEIRFVIYAIGAALARSIEQKIIDKSAFDEIKIIGLSELGELTHQEFDDQLDALTKHS